MKYPDGRPFTLEEISDPSPLWERTSWLVEVKGSKHLCSVGGYVLRNILCVEFLAAYGCSWRIWPYRPTKESRDALPWGLPDTGKDGHTLDIGMVRMLMRPYNDIIRNARNKLPFGKEHKSK